MGLYFKYFIPSIAFADFFLKNIEFILDSIECLCYNDFCKGGVEKSMCDPQSFRQNFADTLKRYRKAAGLSCLEVGGIVGKSDKTVDAWEHGRGQPDAEMLLRLCELYNVESISVFFGQPVDQISDPNEIALLGLFRQLNSEGQEAVINCANGLCLSGAYKKASDSAGLGQTAEVG